MDHERIEGRLKGLSIICCDCCWYSENNEYNSKIDLRCVLYKKIVPVLNYGPVFDGPIFCRIFAAANDEFALIFLAQIDIHNFRVDAVFRTIPVNLYQLLTVHCLVQDTIWPAFYVLVFDKTRLLCDVLFLKTSLSDFTVDHYSSIKFVFGSSLQRYLLHYLPILYRKYNKSGFQALILMFQVLFSYTGPNFANCNVFLIFRHYSRFPSYSPFQTLLSFF